MKSYKDSNIDIETLLDFRSAIEEQYNSLQQIRENIEEIEKLYDPELGKITAIPNDESYKYFVKKYSEDQIELAKIRLDLINAETEIQYFFEDLEDYLDES